MIRPWTCFSLLFVFSFRVIPPFKGGVLVYNDLNSMKIFSLLFVFGAFLAQIIFLKFRGRLGLVYAVFSLALLSVILGVYGHLVYAQYLEWNNPNSITKYFVPPYRPISYVFQFYFTRFLLYYLVSFLVAAALFFFAKLGNKKYGERFLEGEESWMAAMAVFILGHNDFRYGWIWYLVLITLAAVAGSFYYRIRGRKNERVSLYWMWLPTALSVIILRGFLAPGFL